MKRPLGCHIVMVLSLIALGILIHSNSSAEVIQIFPGPEGGNIKALAINPVNTNTLYAGTGGGGVFKSTNGGDTWSAVNTGLTSFFVQALAINPNTPRYAICRNTRRWRIQKHEWRGYMVCCEHRPEQPQCSSLSHKSCNPEHAICRDTRWWRIQKHEWRGYMGCSQHRPDQP